MAAPQASIYKGGQEKMDPCHLNSLPKLGREEGEGPGPSPTPTPYYTSSQLLWRPG